MPYEENRKAWTAIQNDLREARYIYSSMFALTAAAYVTRKWTGDPLWLMFVAPPGTGKSCAMMLFRDADEVILESSITPAGLVTAWGGKANDPSLLATSDGKLLCFKDFGTVLSLGYEAMSQVLSTLREAFDGQFSKKFASTTRIYEGSFNLVASATDSTDLHVQLSSHLGERFLRFRPEQVSLPWPISEIKQHIHGKVATWIKSIEHSPHPPTDKEEWIFSLARMSALLRSPIMRDKRTGEVAEVALPEAPYRLAKQFSKLYQGLVVVMGDKEAARELVETTAIGTIPPNRRKLLHYIQAMERDRPPGTADLQALTHLGSRMIQGHLEDLFILKVLNRTKAAGREIAAGLVPNTFLWEMHEDFRALMNGMEVEF